MKFPSLELPLTPDKGPAKEESVAILESKEQKTLEYAKIARQFYDAMKRRDDLAAKENIKNVMLGKKIERRTLYLPEAQFQNNLTALLYPGFTTIGSSLGAVITKIKTEINTMLAQDKRLEDRDREEKRVGLHKDLDKMMTGVESALIVAKKRAEKGKQSDEYLLGTNDALDATKKIDLIEYSQKGTRTEIKFVQVKTQDMDMNEIQDATTAHQAYLNSFIDTIQSLLKKSDIEAAHALLTPEGAFRDPAVKKSVKEKFEMMSMALADLPETIQTTKEFLSHVHEQSGKQREPISEEDVSIFLHAFENEQSKKDFEIFLGPDSMPDGGVENLAARADQLEEDVAHVLQRYFSKQGGVDMRSVDFYSVSETPNKVFLEKKLANPLREYEEMSELDKIAA